MTPIAETNPPVAETERRLGRSIARGLMRRCPQCGAPTLFSGYLSVSDHCAACGEDLSRHRADDAPPWATILIVGHIVAPTILFVEQTWRPPMWAHWAIWPGLTAALALALLPRVKGAVVGLQWALRMHGFGEK